LHVTVDLIAVPAGWADGSLDHLRHFMKRTSNLQRADVVPKQQHIYREHSEAIMERMATADTPMTYPYLALLAIGLIALAFIYFYAAPPGSRMVS
jgi:hypothetical protein